MYQLGENGAKDKFKLKYQLENILINYIKEIWHTTTGKKIKPKPYQAPTQKNPKLFFY